MFNNSMDPEGFERDKRLIILSLGVALMIQLVVLFVYYFKEKEDALVFPMILGIFTTFFAIMRMLQLGK